MVMINRGSIQANCTELLDLKQPIQQAQNFIQPTIDVGPRITNITKELQTSTTTNATTILTTPIDKDFFITLADISFTKDATCDNIVTYIDYVQNGARIKILPIYTQTTTAGSFSRNAQYNHPIKVDRNTTIRLISAFTAGTSTKVVIIGGYILE